MDKKDITAKNIVTNTWHSVKYVLGLCLLMIIINKINYFVQIILYYFFDVPLESLAFKITVIVMQITILQY